MSGTLQTFIQSLGQSMSVDLRRRLLLSNGTLLIAFVLRGEPGESLVLAVETRMEVLPTLICLMLLNTMAHLKRAVLPGISTLSIKLSMWMQMDAASLLTVAISGLPTRGLTGNALVATSALSVTMIPPKGRTRLLRLSRALRARGGGSLSDLKALETLVHEQNACAMPGCTIKYDSFMLCLRRAVSRGYVKDVHAKFVEDGLTKGFSIGIEPGSLKGRRVFANYPSSHTAPESVSAAVFARVKASKTLCLGLWSEVKPLLDVVYRDYFVFPMGATPKPHQPDVMRPTSDHTRTGLNAATVMGILKHSLDTYNEVSWFLKKDYFMRVSDVADAFLLIPLAPWLWPFFLFRWYGELGGSGLYLYAHVFGDFGTRGLPGTFKIFLVDVVVQMARSELVLTLPLAVYVDDSGLIGPDAEDVDSEAEKFHQWSEKECGVEWKILKERHAARLQYMIGFWWNSVNLTRELDEDRRTRYIERFDEAGKATLLTLRERQKLAGWGQRAVLTFPPGASCLLTTCYLQQRGLKLLWHSRRTTRAERLDYCFIRDLLKLNMGKGYYSHAHLSTAPVILSDASDSRKYSGGGWSVARFTTGMTACASNVE